MTDIQFDRGLIETMLNAIKEWVAVIDRDLRFVYQNETFMRSYGDCIGKKCFICRGRSAPCADCSILDVLQDGKPESGMRDCRLPDGKILIFEFNAVPLKDADGKIIGALKVFRDVTQQIRLTQECYTLRREIVRQGQFENIITQSKKMESLFKIIERVASTTSSVMITGESGTGKELIAKAIYANSDRKDKPFVSINCGAIPENLIESELFGHVKGSFTGAIGDHIGLIETADKGTLFLDEVGEIPLNLQVKLLRFLQEGEARRVGDTRIRKNDVRIICATNRNLEQAVKKGLFREDLFFRLNVIPISIPPLRDRIEDIPLLANFFMQRLCDEYNRDVSGISSRALKVLMDYSWPGNVRELENTMEYAVHLAEEGQPIKVAQLSPKIRGMHDVMEEQLDHLSVEGFIKQTILALQDDHTEEGIASILGISRKSLWDKRKLFDIKRPGRSRRYAT